MTSPKSRLCLATALALALAACGDGAQQSGGEAAKGDVLEGSASDEMIQYDTLRSQPPLAERTEIETGEEGNSARDNSDEGSAAAE